MINKLLSLTKEIIDLCDLAISDKSSPNIEVIRIIRNEFEEQNESLNNYRKVIVLNNRNDIWALRTITDSAYYEYDQYLFNKVNEFAKLCKKLPNKNIKVLYK